MDSTQRSSFLPSQDFCPSYFHQEMLLGGEFSETACALLDVAQTFIDGGGDCLLLPAWCQNPRLLCYCADVSSRFSKSSHLSCWTLLCCSLCYWLCEIVHFLMKAVVSSVLICQMLLLFLLAGKSRFVVAAVSGLALVSGMTWSPGVQMSDDMIFLSHLDFLDSVLPSCFLILKGTPEILLVLVSCPLICHEHTVLLQTIVGCKASCVISVAVLASHGLFCCLQ